MNKIVNNETYKLVILISFKERHKKVINLLDSIFLKNKFNEKDILVLLINDGSINTDLKLNEKIKNNKNILYFKNKNSKQKFNNAVLFSKFLPDFEWITWLDDKDYFENNWFNKIKNILTKKNEDNIIILDYYNQENKIIGNTCFGYKTMEEFYLTKNKIGDKVWIIAKKNWQKINQINLGYFKNEKIYNFDLLTLKLMQKKIIFFKDFKIFHEYQKDGITKSDNFEIKKRTPIFEYETSIQKLNMNICFINKIYRMFVLWIIRKNINIFLKLKFTQKLLYFCLYLFFPVIKKYVIFKLKII